MSTKKMFVMGFLSMMVASGVVQVSDSVASEAQRVDVIERIGAGGSTYSSSRSMPVQPGDAHVAGIERRRVDVIARIGAGGSTYSFSRPILVQPGDSVAGTEQRKVDVIERIGAGGSTYSFSQPMLARPGDGATSAYSQPTSH
ncbi:MAG: hypothetical protein OEY77_03715 [Nitrospira sp.]|nr:hypothetical protein [Nitrospira sp.]